MCCNSSIRASRRRAPSFLSQTDQSPGRDRWRPGSHYAHQPLLVLTNWSELFNLSSTSSASSAWPLLKSRLTGGHCPARAALTMMLAKSSACGAGGPLAGFHDRARPITKLKMAGLLRLQQDPHPVHVVDKAANCKRCMTALAVETRVEVLKRDAELAALRRQLALRPVADTATGGIQKRCSRTDGAGRRPRFCVAVNQGGGNEPSRPAAGA